MAMTLAIKSTKLGRLAITFALVLSLLGTGSMVLQPAARAQSAGTPLLAIGTDVVSANAKSATYRIVVRNAGNAQATDVRTHLVVPERTTFESSSPETSPVDGSAPGAVLTCDNGGTREVAGSSCQWSLGSLDPGAINEISVVLNMLPSATGIRLESKVIGKSPSTGAALAEQSDADSSLLRKTMAITDASGGQDTWVRRSESADTNHGDCEVLTTSGVSGTTAYIDLPSTDPNSLSAIVTNVEQVWAAELHAQVAASDYSASAPGTLSLHAIESGEWGEGTGPCAPGTLNTNPNIRTGWEPATESVATSSKTIGGTGPVIWNVVGDLDGASERAAFQGWEIRNTSGFGSVDLHSSEAADSAQTPRVLIVYTTPEPALCIDVDPDSSVGFPTGEQTVSAVVYDTPTDRIVAGTRDACNGTPVAGTFVDWNLRDGNPDAYISNRAGTHMPKSGTLADAGPDVIRTTTNQSGQTHIGIRLANSQFSNGENRIEACIGPVEPPTGIDVCPSSNSGPDAEPEDCPDPNPNNLVCTPGDGETAKEDDARLTWSTSAPAPEETPTASQGPPSVSSFSPTAGAVGTSVVVNGSSFTGASAVRFNGRASAFTVESPNRITATVPTGATDGPISVQTPAGTTVSAANFDVTPSPSTSPTPGATNSSGSTATPGATVTPTALSAVNLSLASSAEKSVAFSDVVLSGVLSSDLPTCAQPGTTIEILKREAEATSFDHLAYTDTGVGGLFEQEVKPEANTMYSAVIGEHATCDAGISSPVTVLVSPKVTAKTTAKKVEAGRRFWLTGSVLPEHQLTPVTIWRKKGPGQFKKIGKDFLDASSRYALAIRYTWKAPKSIFLVRWKATDADHVSGKSARVRVERA